MSKTHAQILADIAAEVAAQHRAKATERFPSDGYQGLIEPRKDQDAELSCIDSSWHYRLPERWQG